MAWNTFGAHTSGTALTVADGDKIAKNVEQLARDIYVNPTSNDNGLATLSFPLQLGSTHSAMALGNGSTGVVVSLPTAISVTDADDYEVFLTWQENPGSNGASWVEKTTTNFTIKHSGSELGKKIAYQIVRKTVS